MSSACTCKTTFFVLLISIAMLLFGCSQTKEPEYFTQSSLPQPDRIEVTSGSNLVTYEKETVQYQKLFTIISKNWWKTTDKGEAYADDSTLVEVESLESLRTTSDRTYITTNDVVIRFLYANTPVSWDITVDETKKSNYWLLFFPKTVMNAIKTFLDFSLCLKQIILAQTKGYIPIIMHRN